MLWMKNTKKLTAFNSFPIQRFINLACRSPPVRDHNILTINTRCHSRESGNPVQQLY